MIKLMIVDDNHLALEYLSSLVDWHQMGFDLICTAGDGETAFILFGQYHPDVVITDVQMPNMNGIELTRKIRSVAPDTLTLFLSSYEEFVYIRSAMQLGVYDYILKHEMTAETLCAKLTDIKKTYTQLNTQTHYIAEGALYAYLEGRHDNNELLSRFPLQYDLVLVFEDTIIPQLSKLMDMPQSDGGSSRTHSWFYQQPGVEAVVQNDVSTHLVLCVSNHPALEQAHQWKSQYYASTSHSITCLIIAENMPILAGLNQYGLYKALVNQKYFYPTSSVINIAMFRQVSPGPAIVSSEQLAAMLTSGAFNEFFRLMDSLYTDVHHSANSDAAFTLLHTFGKTLLLWHEKVWDTSRHTMFSAYSPTDHVLWYDIPSAFFWLKERFTTLTRLLGKGSHYSTLVTHILQYIQSHYADSDLGAETIADAFNLSINRLNSLIKKETDSTVWKLLIQIRMEKAKHLLIETDMSVSDICEQVGYKALSHFSDSFRKMFKLSPSECRRKKENETL